MRVIHFKAFIDIEIIGDFPGRKAIVKCNFCVNID